MATALARRLAAVHRQIQAEERAEELAAAGRPKSVRRRRVVPVDDGPLPKSKAGVPFADVYRSEETGLDPLPTMRWTVMCDEHLSHLSFNERADAEAQRTTVAVWCDGCRLSNSPQAVIDPAPVANSKTSTVTPTVIRKTVAAPSMAEAHERLKAAERDRAQQKLSQYADRLVAQDQARAVRKKPWLKLAAKQAVRRKAASDTRAKARAERDSNLNQRSAENSKQWAEKNEREAAKRRVVAPTAAQIAEQLRQWTKRRDREKREEVERVQMEAERVKRERVEAQAADEREKEEKRGRRECAVPVEAELPVKTHKPSVSIIAEDGAWAVLCGAHGTRMTAETHGAAESQRTRVVMWCTGCKNEQADRMIAARGPLS